MWSKTYGTPCKCSCYQLVVDNRTEHNNTEHVCAGRIEPEICLVLLYMDVNFSDLQLLHTVLCEVQQLLRGGYNDRHARGSMLGGSLMAVIGGCGVELLL